MLKLTILGEEFYNEATNEFSTIGDVELEFEHSLVSLSKWESKFEKPFLGPGDKTQEEVLGYVEAMLITPNPPENFIHKLSQENFNTINDYINSTQSGTTFRQEPGGARSREIISSELVYYWMVSYNIPFQPAESWHLNRLFNLLRVCSVKNSKPRKMSRQEAQAQRTALNEQRRAALNSRG